MSINVSTFMGFENSEAMMKNNAKSFPQNNSVNTVNSNTGENLTVYTNGIGLPSQQYVLMASTQITVNNNLRETLKYLRTRGRKIKKEHVFGELWQILNTENEQSEKIPYQGDLIDFEIDSNKKNIFAA